MTATIRILHVVSAMNMAGTETLLMSLYRNIDRGLIQFDFAVSAEAECDYDDEIMSLGGRVFHYPRYRGINHFQYRKWWRDFLLEHTEYRIVHGHIGSTAAIYLGIAKRLNRYTIAHSHSTRESISLHSILYRMYSYPTRFIANFFFGCSRQALVDRFGRQVADDNHRSAVLKNGIDVERFKFDQAVRNRVRTEYGVGQGSIVIGTVGRLTPPKNPLEIIAICKRLKELGLDYTFWWFGNGELEDEIAGRIKRDGLNGTVRLMGSRPDINNVLQGMDIFLFPSIREGLGIACVEAQAAGLPTLCSDVIPAEAKITEACRYLPLNDTERWCEEIISLANKVRSNSCGRVDESKVIRDAGYDIRSISSFLEDFYLAAYEVEIGDE